MTGEPPGPDETRGAPRPDRSPESFPSEHRIRRGSEFAAVFEGGSSAAGRFLVVHLLRSNKTTSRLGLAVARRVGGAVVRNRVRRRLRESFRRRLRRSFDASQGPVDVVVRALPPASGASQAELEAELAGLVARARRRKPPVGDAPRELRDGSPA